MKTLLLAAGLAALTLTAAPAQHSHGYAGDFDSDGFLDFGDASTGQLQLHLGTRSMAFADTGIYAAAGFLYNGSWTPTALAAPSSPSELDGAASGTRVELVLHGVSGPEGATFGFFEAGATTATLNLTTGSTGGTGLIRVTEDAFYEETPSDPYGHIHGRRFVATAPGTYTITWALANSGSGGTAGSLENPNAAERFFTQTWTVVPEPGTLALVGIAAVLGLGAVLRHRRR